MIDGVLLDLIIDYLTYVFIPAYALFASGLLPGWTGWVAIIVITFASALYFADTRMKTKDNSFSGFPGCWNMVAVVIFALKPDFWVSLAWWWCWRSRCSLRLKFIHPVRTEALAAGVAAMALAWTVLCRLGGLGGFPPPKLGALGACRDLGLSAGGRRP
jgi:phosphatidylcholine synthase